MAISPRMVTWLVGDVAVTDLTVDDAGITVIRKQGGAPAPSVTVPREAVTTSSELRDLRTGGRSQVRLLLTPDQVLVKTFSLPAAVEENLRDVVGFELDRHTPFKASQAYYDVKVLRRDAQKETIDVVLAVAARSQVDTLLATLRGAGLAVAAIGLFDAAPLGGLSLDLLPLQDRPPRKWGNLLRVNLALAAGVMVAVAVAVLLPIWQKREKVIALIPLVGRTSAEYDASQRIFDEYTRLANQYNYIVTRKQGTYPTVMVLEELTHVSPDTTWLQSLEMKTSGKTRELVLLGEAQSASRVMEILEQSAYFQNATQRSQTMRGSQPNLERFHVATELKPRALPPATVGGEAVVAQPPVAAPPRPPVAAVTPAPMVQPAGPANGAPVAVPAAATSAPTAKPPEAAAATAPPPKVETPPAPKTAEPSANPFPPVIPANRRQP